MVSPQARTLGLSERFGNAMPSAEALMHKLVLFDIDGTLLVSGGAGLRAMDRTFQEVFEITGGFDGIPMPGRTDAAILDEAMRRHGLDTDPTVVEEFNQRYNDRLVEEIQYPGLGKGVMPGARELLDLLTARHDVVVGLLTGNLASAARIKLDHFGLGGYFSYGAYGSDAPERNNLLPIAVSRARAQGAVMRSVRDVLVVGDTPLDVACAAAAGAKMAAVATGQFDETALKASGAEVVLSDLRDTTPFLGLLDGR